MFDRLRPGYYLLFALVAVQFVLVFPVGGADPWFYLSTRGLTGTLLPAWSLFPLAWLFGIAVVLVRRRVDHPLRAMRRMVYANRKWLGRCSILAILLITFARTITSYKTAIPEIVPFWADPHLVAIDRSIFGTDPWRLTHALIGPTGTIVLDRLYALWFGTMMLTLGWFSFSRNAKFQLRGLLTSSFSWSLLGVVGATAFSSVGPCYYQHFYGDAHFAPLMADLQATHQQHQLWAILTMDGLLGAFGKDKFGAGISAMPSIHVTVATMIFLACKNYGNRWWLTLISGCYALAILIGSVHLGWHYASDGLVGIVAVTLIWWGSGRFVDYLDARDRERLPAAPAPVRSLPATA
ncbi:MAG: phosphatase PAP2 family protein [Novosphingobium sp.]